MKATTEKERLAITPGRFLYCKDCRGFRRMAIEPEMVVVGEEEEEVLWDESKGQKQKAIFCRECLNEQARLIPWGEEEWIDERFSDNVGLTITTILGMNRVVGVIRGPEKKKEKQVKTKQKRKDRRFNWGNWGSFNRSKILQFGVAIPAMALGVLYLALTAISLQYGVYVWPFTLAWDAVVWMGADNVLLGGILAASVAIALGVLGIILRRR